jgi:hypothetical protein
MNAVSEALLHDLQRELREIERDMRTRIDSDSDLAPVVERLTSEHKAAADAGRTAVGLAEWIDHSITQSAVGWVLGTVFVRFCEDNRLVNGVWLAASGGRAHDLIEVHEQHFRQNPIHNDSDWIIAGFGTLADLPATAGIFDARNPLWQIQPSAQAATRLVQFWRQTGDDGTLVHDFTDEQLDTWFLGDLYQFLSETARKRYALLQTPEFVATFILDRTLKRAMQERDLDGLKLIDPTCGSGHFLLGAFHRLLAAWVERYPGMDTRDRIQKALDSIHGVDLNPFAVEIARFRLTIAALKASGLTALAAAPAFRYHLAVGDSLLHGDLQGAFDLGPQYDADAKVSGFAYAAEDLNALKVLLEPGQYDVVVGNPPYIVVTDRALSRAYKRRFPKTCRGQYHLSAPFTERFFQLARWGDDAGHVGMITDNAFMKRDFGEKLILELFPRLDLTEIIDTAGAFIPGHGTPTVILVGRNTKPASNTVRAVLGLRGEPGEPADPANGLVWSAILAQVDRPGTKSTYVSSIDLKRSVLADYPWTLGAGLELKLRLDRDATKLLGRMVTVIGRTAHTGADDAFFGPVGCWQRRGVRSESIASMVEGKALRDWICDVKTDTLFPYDAKLMASEQDANLMKVLWPAKVALADRAELRDGKLGKLWFEFTRFHPERFRQPFGLAFAFVASNNHFVVDRGGMAFKQTAPVIRLSSGASEGDYIALAGVLNSSLASFWLKQVCHDRGIRGEGGGFTSTEWERFYEFTSKKLEQFPLPPGYPATLAHRLDELTRELSQTWPTGVREATPPTRVALDAAHKASEQLAAECVTVGEELDWEVYRLYGLVDEDLTYRADDLPKLRLGERAFEVVLAHREAQEAQPDAWFERHGTDRVMVLPAEWPAGYRAVVQRRIDVIEADPDLELLERPEFKRRWDPTLTTAWRDRELAALKGWLLHRLEARGLWFDAADRPGARSAAQLADILGTDREFRDVLALYLGSRDYMLAVELERLMEPESVPFLAAQRYTDAGMRKRDEWERTWREQRKVDKTDPIESPQKYAKADFTKAHFWGHRGEFDIPKERFIAYPTAARDGDPSPVFGWAGWDHAEQAFALAALVIDRARFGWPAQRLVPLLAGILELEPWLHQWHDEYNPTYGSSPAAYLSNFLRQRMADHALTTADLQAWRPTRTSGRRRAG